MDTIPQLSQALEEVVTADDELPSSVHKVVSDDDLLIEILLRLPILSLLFFKSVSKHWLSLITHINSALLPRTSLDPPTGLFVPRRDSPSLYDFVSFNSRIPSRIHPLPFTFNFRLNSEVRFSILDSCNGLLLCEGVDKDNMSVDNTHCIYNPSINLFKMLPKCHDPSLAMIRPAAKLAFDPRKSPHYKVVFVGILHGFEKMEIYSSKTGSWSVCRIPNISHIDFPWGVYCQNAIHWLDSDNEPLHFKLDISSDLPIITKIQLPVTMDKKKPWNHKLFESRGCLLLLAVDSTNSQQFNIYEMSTMSSEWSVKYNLNLGDNIFSWPKTTISGNVWSIVLGKREEDSFLVMRKDKKVLEYKIMAKNSASSMIWGLLLVAFSSLLLSRACDCFLSRSYMMVREEDEKQRH